MMVLIDSSTGQISSSAWKCVVSLVYCIAATASSINAIDGVYLNVLHGQ